MQDIVVYACIILGDLVLDGCFGIGVLSVLQRGALSLAIKHRKSFTADHHQHKNVCPEELVEAV